MFKTQCKIQNRPKLVFFYSQDEWHQGYNNKSANLRRHRFARDLLQVKTEHINLVK